MPYLALVFGPDVRVQGGVAEVVLAAGAAVGPGRLLAASLPVLLAHNIMPALHALGPYNNQTPMHQLSKNLLTSMARPPIDIQQLTRGCSGAGIKLQRFQDSQIELAYSILGFKASEAKHTHSCLIFLGVLDTGMIFASSYSQGELLLRRSIGSEREIPSFIQASMLASQQQHKGLQLEIATDPLKQAKQVQRLFDSLSKQSHKILKNTSSQMLAVQELKSSPEYLAICNQTKEHTLQLAQFCKTVRARQLKLESRSADTIALMLQVEAAKEEVQAALNGYAEVVQKLGDTQRLVKTDTGSGTDETDAWRNEDNFRAFLGQLKQRKKLENIGRFLSQG